MTSVRGRTEGTARRYRRLVERLLRDVGKPIEQLGREDIERHLRRLHVSGRGESVRQGVVVVEAMKMENELRSPKAGRVKEIVVKAGESVEAGRVLAVIE
mgnify:CR=1 FL=1